MIQQAIDIVDIKRYGNYLTMNNHKPLLRFQFKEYFLQRDYFKKEEEKHLEKLQMALHYIKELNHKKAIEDYVCGEDNDHYCYHYAPQEAESGPGAAHPNNTKLEGPWRRTMVDFCIFPNHLITLMPDYLWWVSVMPDGVSRFKATWGVAVPPEILKEIPVVVTV